MSNYQHKAVYKIQYATSCWPSHTPTQNIQLPTHSCTFNSVRQSLMTHTKTQNVQLTTYSRTYNSMPLPAEPLTLQHICPTTNTQQYTQFSTPPNADPLTLPHKMCNYQNTAVHTIQYATHCWPPHTLTQIIQLPTHSSTFNSVRHFLLISHIPTQNIQLPTYSSTYNSVCHFLLIPSHSLTKCPTTNTQQYIQFSTPLPADLLTLPHKMSNYQHTAVQSI